MPCSFSSAGRSSFCRCWASPTPPSTFAAALQHAAAHPLPAIPKSETRSEKRRTTMEVILLERVAKLGQMGEVVRVKDGFARNFLLPQGKALRATEANKAKFEVMKVDLQ